MTIKHPLFRALLRRTSTVLMLAAGLATSAHASTYQVIHDFTGATGSIPVGSLVADASGDFYGVTSQDTGETGKCAGLGCGNVFKLYKTAAGGWASTNLHKFAGGTKDGSSPQAGLAFDSAGNLYGTTWQGGLYGAGIAFELSPSPASTSGWTYSVIYNFGASYADGEEPQTALAIDASGNLYGSTISGGNTTGYCHNLSCGVVYELSPSSSGTWTETVLHSFSGSDGAWSRGTLVFDTAGNLYGTTEYGGNLTDCDGGGCGTVYELSPNGSGGWTQTVLYNFTGESDGKYPWYAGVIFDSAGNLYGTTGGGGHNSQCNGGCGVIYELSPNGGGGWTETVIHSFTGDDDTPGAAGAWPEYNLTADASGNLYGGAYWGGKDGDGVIYKLSPSGGGIWTESLLHYFTGGSAGAYPYQSGLTFGSDGNLYGMTIGGGNVSDCNNGCGTVFRVTP
jgi:uncharacterized repeat protein (TIGR03803 family)